MILPDKKTLALKTLSIMTGYAAAGVSRQSDPAQIARFCDLFRLPHNSPFCSAAVFYSMSKALCELVGLDTTMQELRGVSTVLAAHYLTPTASCGDILHDAKIRGIWIPRDEALDDGVLPGWLFLTGPAADTRSTSALWRVRRTTYFQMSKRTQACRPQSAARRTAGRVRGG